MKKEEKKQKDKYITTILLKPELNLGNELKEILGCLLWKKPNLSEPATKFLEIIRQENGVEDSYWTEFCRSNNITISQYNSIIRKLRGAGLVYKKDSIWKPSTNFENFLKQVVHIMEEWRKENKNETNKN